MTLEDVDLTGGIVADSILTTTGSDSGGGAVVLNDITATDSSINVSSAQVRFP